ncbi:MAG: metallophosphoesterase [Bacillota bacterium]|nr:metallophosphoesterase [Bacillota bacterium]
MKKIVVMSDSHGYHAMIDLVKELEPDGDYYVHCGDSEAETYDMQDWLCVKGNNDWYSDFPDHIQFKVEDLNFYVCHGHRFGYFDRESKMIYTLQEANCDVLLSGHTHVPTYEKIDGYTFINPGSTTLPRGGSSRSYCVIHVDGKNLDVEFKDLNTYE